jgi:hypothetical protein
LPSANGHGIDISVIEGTEHNITILINKAGKLNIHNKKYNKRLDNSKLSNPIYPG